jgi:4a-hydroxytetrahydrobiopterin dehydratase
MNNTTPAAQDLAQRKCVPCEGGVQPLSRAECERYLSKLAPQWRLNDTATEIRKDFSFVDFYRTMSFVNALAHVANTEDHHPDLEIGYNYCKVCYATHAIKGLSENDFICAAKIDRIDC